MRWTRGPDRLRRPEHTGENRCVPCTVANAAIAVLASIGIGAVLAARFGRATAGVGTALALLVSAGVIYLRGYLIPGTPRLTATYFPDRLLRRFEKDDPEQRVDTAQPPKADGDDPGDAAPAEAVDVEAFLAAAGAVAECENADDLCLTDAFRRAWREEIERLRDADTNRADAASLLDVDAERLSIESYEDAFLARLNGRRVGHWESYAAFLADLAAAAVLRERHERWASLSARSRGQVLSGLRLFLERCPSCDGPVTVDQSVVDSCCRSLDVVAVTCEGCGARVVEIERA